MLSSNCAIRLCPLEEQQRDARVKPKVCNLPSVQAIDAKISGRPNGDGYEDSVVGGKYMLNKRAMGRT
jgi:hypothetical protein